MVKTEQPKLPLRNTPRIDAKCAKCGRVFTMPGQFRYRGSDGAAICRDERACRARGGQ